MYLVNAPSAAIASSGGAASVSIVDTSSERYIGTAGNPLTFSGLTVSSSANAIVALLAFDTSFVNSPSGFTATWDSTATSQSMSLLVRVPSSNGTGSANAIFGLTSPTVGSGRTLSVAWSSGDNARAFMAMVSLINVSTSNAFPTSTSAGNTSTVTLNSAVGHLVLCTGTAGSAISPTDNIIYSDATTGAVINAWANWKAGTSPTATIGEGGTPNVLAAVDVSN